jgi:hypothetical protein
MQYYYDNLDNSALLDVARLHLAKFNQAWLVVMTNHYKSGIYIDAKVKMERQYEIIGELERYIYNSRPSTLYDSFKALDP